MRHFDTLRQSAGSPAVIAAFDLPWVPVYIGVAFILHPALGVLTVVSCVLLLLLALANERATHSGLVKAQEAANISYAYQQQMTACAAEIRALGMAAPLVSRQMHERKQMNELQARASLVASNYGQIIKFVRLMLQSVALGLGGYLAIEHQISAGMVFAASLILSKSAQPVEQIVGGWKSIVQGVTAYHRVSDLLRSHDWRDYIRLPEPTGQIQLEALRVATPDNTRIAIKDITLQIAAGEVIGVVGLSGAGKSSLLRALAGASPAAGGAVRFDGTAYPDWNPAQITLQIGYLPQDFALFPGSIKDNISRFAAYGNDEVDVDDAVIRAAKLVGVHDRILKLPNGYATKIGLGGVGLSAGQTQRIALARAIYGDPKILILDEPNAHLDTEGNAALFELIGKMREQGSTVIFSVHNGDLIAIVDKLLVLQEGMIARFGPIQASRHAPVTPVPVQPPSPVPAPTAPPAAA
jgi:PrtD family type I secretion system ABC transporter